MPAKLIGLAFLGAAWLIRRDVRRARERGYVGPAHQPIRREQQRMRFNAAVAARMAGVVICLVAAYLCFTAPHTGH